MVLPPNHRCYSDWTLCAAHSVSIMCHIRLIEGGSPWFRSTPQLSLTVYYVIIMGCQQSLLV